MNVILIDIFFYLKYNGGTIIVDSYPYYSCCYHYLFLNQGFKNANSQEKCPQNIWIIDLRFSNSTKNVFIYYTANLLNF